MLKLTLLIISLSICFSYQDGTIYLFDLSYVNKLPPEDAYEHTHLVATISGLANRDMPRFYYFFTKSD